MGRGVEGTHRDKATGVSNRYLTLIFYPNRDSGVKLPIMLCQKEGQPF